MALLSPRADYQIRHPNKEPEWSSLCNNVFDQYLDTDDLFGLEPDRHERNSSQDSCNLFDFSGGSEQSHQTEGTSPLPSWGPAHEAKQPTAREPVDFWQKTLRALEHNAAKSEQKQQKLRTTKSHPDFLSLGGCPSPPAIPTSPVDQSFSAQRRLSRSSANGKKRNITARSVSRGRPTGVAKSTVAGSANPHATARKCSVSPAKMMTPSRYRAGFKDVWVEKLRSSPKRYELRVPSSALPASPPASARALHEDEYAAGFGSSPLNAFPPLPGYDDQLSPLATTFQQAHIHTPTDSPAINVAAHAANSYLDHPRSNPYAGQTVPLNDTAPLYPEGSSSLATNDIEAFDFGFSSSPDLNPWSAASFAEPSTAHYTTDAPTDDAFGAFIPVLPSTESVATNAAGLGISCDPSLVSNYAPVAQMTATRPTSMYEPVSVAPGAYYLPSHPHGLPRTPYHPHGLPNTSQHRRAQSCLRSQSPSPPATEPRSTQRPSSHSRRASRHRRTKSTNSTPRQPQGQEKSGFVNFTPHDSNKILSGVAPSGSSKTKARREKEAADRRRRLS